MNTDTIAAIATALSDSGIGIIRISGEDAIEVGNRIFRNPAGRQILMETESHTIHYGYVVEEGHVLDEVMVSVMRAPKSFTAEDTVEINCHGGILIMRKILELVCRNGARLAEPGEFTKRAFLNGRIDLSKAEAVMDVIKSQNEYALRSSMNRLQGKLSDRIRYFRDRLIYEIAFIESALDDPEHISLEGYPERLREKIDTLLPEIQNLIDTADHGRLMREGISTVIVGKPNVGKSSLLNSLLGEDRAIVTDVAGTTRDVLQESVMLHGIGLNIVDTAGIRDTDDIVEKIGVEKAKKYALDADLILYVADVSKALDDSDREIISMMRDKKSIVLMNKSDLEPVMKEQDLCALMDEILPGHGRIPIISTSILDHTGMDIFENTIREMFFQGELKSNDEAVIINMRHKESLQNALESLNMVKKSIKDEMPEDFYSIDLMNAYSELGRIIGEQVEDDLVNEIFAQFCMGK
ncbi:MAG: tRNA uridine-5-carboxymethylaminomethyl(34) synthesis GTPase MnmE [Acetatifactor muris]|nr:tRNA uridine-5-carboxymethylaminomethyl(34) synthesis GTPase MnmE [Acetatifactor muris]MCM1525629.1 tRNA uridine-5-carboxymethylaminomethyl(34) synthesis GTPase MnmE [Bacteroides sp.]